MKRVMFVCQKNSCRSQMAEGFARNLEKGSLSIISSAGLQASQVHPLAVQVMSEVGIDISNQTSKLLGEFNPQEYDVVASMCGCGLDLPPDWLMTEIFQEWMVDDPSEQPLETFRQVRDEVRKQVEILLLFLSLRRQQLVSIDSHSKH